MFSSLDERSAKQARIVGMPTKLLQRSARLRTLIFRNRFRSPPRHRRRVCPARSLLLGQLNVF
jgi:hypothetical protein